MLIIRSWLRYLLLWLASTLMFFVIDGYLFFLLWILMTLLPLASFIGMHLLRGRIQIELNRKEEKTFIRFKSSRIAPLGSIQLFYQLHNLFYDTVFTGDITLPSHPSRRVRIPAEDMGSGVYEISVNSYILRDMLGLFCCKRELKKELTFTQLPQAQEAFLHELEQEGLESSASYDPQLTGTDYELKEYQPQDSIKNIHYKMSYKLSKLLVKKFDPAKEVSWTLFADFSGDKEECETVLGILYSMALYVTQQGESLEVFWYRNEEVIGESILLEEDISYCFDQILSYRKTSHAADAQSRSRYGLLIDKDGMQVRQEVDYETI